MSATISPQADWAPTTAKRVRAAPAVLASGILLVLLLTLALTLSPRGVNVGVGDAVRVIVDKTPLLRLVPHATPESAAEQIIWEIRLPRALAAAMIGALLAYAGVALQGLLMNPLADPYTVGVS